MVSREEEELERVNKDELIYDWDTDELLYQNEPFTGLAFGVQYNGKRESECPYLNGFSHGTCTQYYSDGKTPSTQTNYNNGTKHVNGKGGTLQTRCNLKALPLQL